MSNNTPLDPIPEDTAFETLEQRVPHIAHFDEVCAEFDAVLANRREHAKATAGGVAMVPCTHSEMTIDGLGQATCNLCKSELWFDRRTSNWSAKNSPIVPGIKTFDSGPEPLVCNSYQEIRLNWLQRMARLSFPARHLEPESIPDMKDCLTSVVRSEFSFADRIRILFSGRLETTVRVSVTVPIGRTATVAQAIPRPPKWIRLD